MIPLLPSALGRCRLGVGRIDITPPADAYHRNWGAALHDAAEGIHRPLLATVLVFADEPTGNLDGAMAIEVMEILQAINLRGTTVMVATHDTGLMNRFPFRKLRFEAGRLVES